MICEKFAPTRQENGQFVNKLRLVDQRNLQVPGFEKPPLK